jgi:outer membrane protein OmpA-like peptidoglycan-associated protein
MAEHFPYLDASVHPDQPLGPEHGLRFEFELVRQQLDVLVLEGAERCFPATVVQSRERQNRIARELQGGLAFDAANDLIVQRKSLVRLERRLDKVNAHVDCREPVANPAADQQFGRRLYELLNSDNQFATNSSVINPKYMGRLAEAAFLLKNKQTYQLQITGHADLRGSHEQNDALALARAQQVKRYLQIFGIPTELLQVDAVGSSDPLFPGNGDQILLTNRRVSIELISRPTTQHRLLE